MPAAPIPPPFERLGSRRFAFYPAIRSLACNEWTYRRTAWPEVLVRNMGTGEDVWIPRRFLGECAETGHAVASIRLVQELEYREGEVRPCSRRVIEMPRAATQVAPPRPAGSGPAPVVGIRLERTTDSLAGRLLLGSIAIGVLGCLAVVGYSLEGQVRQRRVFSSLERSYLVLSAADDYRSVVRGLGTPADETWRQVGERRFRILDYPEAGFRAVLMSERDRPARYIGALDLGGRMLQSVLLPDGAGSGSALHVLEAN